MTDSGRSSEPAELHFARGGQADAPALLLIHPMGSDHSFWDGCRGIWESRYDCVAPDLRGAGMSPRSEVALSIQDHAADLDAFAERIGPGRCVIIGCAVGAMIASVLASRMDGRCAALVLSNPGYRTKPEARESLARRAADVRRGGMAAVLPATLDSAFAGCPPEARRNSFEKRFARQDPKAYALQIEGMLDADTSSFLPKVACPTLIVAGGRDILLPPEHARQVHAAISGSEYVLIEDGAHFMPWQQPERFARLVTGFLERKLDR